MIKNNIQYLGDFYQKMFTVCSAALNIQANTVVVPANNIQSILE